MTQILTYLQGKKTSIATILGAIIIYCLTKGIIDADLAQLLSAIMVGLGITVNIAGARMAK